MSVLRTALFAVLVVVLCARPSVQITTAELESLEHDITFLQQRFRMKGSQSFLSVDEAVSRVHGRRRQPINIASQESWGSSLESLAASNKKTEWAALKEEYAEAVGNRQAAQDEAEENPSKDATEALKKAESAEAVALAAIKKAGEDRARIVRSLVAKVIKEAHNNDPNVMNKISVMSVGSTNPTSDYDITVVGEKADIVVKNFNEMFETKFGRTSGDVFDTNIYGFGFSVPKSLFAKTPACHENPWQDDEDRELMNPSPSCMPTPAEQQAAENDLTMLVPMDQSDEDRDAQNMMAIMKCLFYINRIHNGKRCTAANAQTQDGASVNKICAPARAFQSYIENYMNRADAYAGTEGSKSAASASSGQRRQHLKTSKQKFQQIFALATHRLDDLMTRYCGGDKNFPNLGEKYCKTVNGEKGPRKEINLDDMAARNRAYEDMLGRVHKIFRGEATAPPCKIMKQMVYDALFYAPETYWTQSSFLFIVMALQATSPSNVKDVPALNRWLQYRFSPAQYFDIFTENLADLIKESGHGYEHDWDYEEYAVAASKYITRLLLASQPIVSWPEAENNLKDGNVFFKLQQRVSGLVSCLKEPVAQLAGEVRGKAATADLLRKKEQLLETVVSCYEHVMSTKTTGAHELADWYHRLVAQLGSDIIAHYFNNQQHDHFIGRDAPERYYAIGQLPLSGRDPPKPGCKLTRHKSVLSVDAPPLPAVPAPSADTIGSTTSKGAAEKPISQMTLGERKLQRRRSRNKKYRQNKRSRKGRKLAVLANTADD